MRIEWTMTIVFLSFGVQTTTLRPNKSLFQMLCIYVYFPFSSRNSFDSPAGRSDPYWDLGETVPEVLSTASGGTQTEGTVSLNTD